MAFDALHDRFQLHRYRRAHRRHNREYERWIKATTTDHEKEALAAEQYAVFRDTIEPYLNKAETRHALRVARRYGVASPAYPNGPEGDEFWRWCSYQGYSLTDEGHWGLSQRIREVQTHRRQLLAILTGFVGVLAALVSALIALGLLRGRSP